MINIFQRIRNLREDLDMTQKEIANYLNIHQTTYSEYELGKSNFSVQSLMKLAVIFDTSIDYLVELTDEKKPYKRK